MTEYSNYLDSSRVTNTISQIRISLDQIALHTYGDASSVESFLEYINSEYVGTTRPTDQRKQTKYSRIIRYQCGSEEIICLFNPGKGSLRIVFSSPTQQLIDTLKSDIAKNGLEYILSKVEIPVDFYSIDTVLLKKLVERSVWLKGARTSYRYPPEGNEHTLYINDPRNSAQAIRIYLKPSSVAGVKKLRVELQLNRRALKKHGINCLDELTKSNLDSLLAPIHFYNFRHRLFFDRVRARNPSALIQRHLQILNDIYNRDGLPELKAYTRLRIDSDLLPDSPLQHLFYDRILGKRVRALLPDQGRGAGGDPRGLSHGHGP